MPAAAQLRPAGKQQLKLCTIVLHNSGQTADGCRGQCSSCAGQQEGCQAAPTKQARLGAPRHGGGARFGP